MESLEYVQVCQRNNKYIRDNLKKKLRFHPYGKKGELPLSPNMKKVDCSVGSGVRYPWAAHRNFAMQRPYKDTVGSSVGSPNLPNMKK